MLNHAEPLLSRGGVNGFDRRLAQFDLIASVRVSALYHFGTAALSAAVTKPVASGSRRNPASFSCRADAATFST